MKTIIAIDFGTSNSTVGYPTDHGPKLLDLELGSPITPSAVFYNLEENTIQYGRSAISAYLNHYDGRLLRALKSTLGSALIDESTKIGDKNVRIRDIIRKFIGHLRQVAESATNLEAEDVLLGRPVWFIDNDPTKDRLAENQLRDIAIGCGFKDIHFQYEPIAAAIDYESRVDREELALVADIGGGTSDFSLVRVSPDSRTKLDRKSDVLSNSGVHVGGTDFDKYLSLAHVMHHLGYKSHQKLRPELQLPSSIYFDLATWHRIALLYNNRILSSLKELHSLAAQPELVHRLIRVVRERTGHQLAGDVERAKISLSQDDEVTLALPYVDDQLRIKISASELAHASGELIARISASILDCLKKASVRPGSIQTLFLTGGTSSIPFVRDCCMHAVPNATLVEGDKLGSVGLGLTIEAGLRGGSHNHPAHAG